MRLYKRTTQQDIDFSINTQKPPHFYLASKTALINNT